jgi:hypothetical protein
MGGELISAILFIFIEPWISGILSKVPYVVGTDRWLQLK